MNNEQFVHARKGSSVKQIIFFPYLGGYVTAFHNLICELDESIDIWVANPPGHGTSEKGLVEDITELVEMYYEEVVKIMSQDCYIFGHSMGGNIAYFLVKKFFDMKSSIMPKGLIISASAPPLSMKGKNYSGLPDQELLEQIIRYGAIPDELLKEDELLELFIPIFRADYKVLETASLVDINTRPDIDTYLVWAESDSIEPIHLLVKWQEYLDGNIVVLPIKNAGHMMINSHAAEVASCLEKIITGYYGDEEDGGDE